MYLLYEVQVQNTTYLLLPVTSIGTFFIVKMKSLRGAYFFYKSAIYNKMLR